METPLNCILGAGKAREPESNGHHNDFHLGAERARKAELMNITMISIWGLVGAGGRNNGSHNDFHLQIEKSFGDDYFEISPRVVSTNREGI